jgi:hypothetical protein
MQLSVPEVIVTSEGAKKCVCVAVRTCRASISIVIKNIQI